MLRDGRTTDTGVTGILIAHLGAFGSGELINQSEEIGEKHVSLPYLSACWVIVRAFAVF